MEVFFYFLLLRCRYQTEFFHIVPLDLFNLFTFCFCTALHLFFFWWARDFIAVGFGSALVINGSVSAVIQHSILLFEVPSFSLRDTVLYSVGRYTPGNRGRLSRYRTVSVPVFYSRYRWTGSTVLIGRYHTNANKCLIFFNCRNLIRRPPVFFYTLYKSGIFHILDLDAVPLYLLRILGDELW